MRTERIRTDVLIIGGGTAGCFAAYVIGKKSGRKVLIAEKANIKRSGCLAAGVNALNAYITEGRVPQDAGNQVVQAMKEHTDSQHIFHLKNEGTGGYGIMLKQRDYYIYTYLPDTEVFRNLPLSVTAVVPSF